MVLVDVGSNLLRLQGQQDRSTDDSSRVAIVSCCCFSFKEPGRLPLQWEASIKKKRYPFTMIAKAFVVSGHSKN
jgi:hypothetical protein